MQLRGTYEGLAELKVVGLTAPDIPPKLLVQLSSIVDTMVDPAASNGSSVMSEVRQLLHGRMGSTDG